MSAGERFCLDFNVLMQAKNGPYAFDLAPGFWDLIDRSIRGGLVYVCREVYDEILEMEDELATWCRTRKDRGIYVMPDQEVAGRYVRIVEFVDGHDRYGRHHKNRFLAKADPWLIAQAWQDETLVVTMEVKVARNSTKPKIPNICEHFGVRWIDTYEMLRRLGGKLRS